MFVIVRVTDSKYYLIAPDEIGKSYEYTSTLDRTDGSLVLMQGKPEEKIAYNGNCSIAKTMF
jgi:hypothetical protein